MRRLMFIFLTVMLFGLIILSACGQDNLDTDMDEENESEKQQNEENSDTAENDADNESVNEDSDSDQGNEATEDEDQQTEDSNQKQEIVLENEVFRIFEPVPNAVVGNEFTVRGEARVFEASFMYEFEDGHNILDEGSVTASTGAPDWGEFEITITFDEVAYETGTVILYDESQKDGSRQNELFIPVTVEK